MRNLFVYSGLLLLLLIGSCSNNSKQIKPVVSGGIIDITSYNFNNNGYLQINGDWEFYWKHLYSK